MLRLLRDVFDDTASIIHALYGVLAALTEPVSATLVYIAYQYWEHEPVRKKRGDFVEYAVGLAAGHLAKMLLRLHGLHV